MTTFAVAALASGAAAVVAVTTMRAAKIAISSDRIFLSDARWAPRAWSGNSRASSLPERHAWGGATVGLGAVDGGRRGRPGTGLRERVPGSIAGAIGVPGGDPPEGATGCLPW